MRSLQSNGKNILLLIILVHFVHATYNIQHHCPLESKWGNRNIEEKTKIIIIKQ